MLSYLMYRPLLSNLRIFARRCLVVVTAFCRPRLACALMVLSGFAQFGFKLDAARVSPPLTVVVLLPPVLVWSLTCALLSKVNGPVGGVSSSGEFNKLPAVFRLEA